MEFARILLLEPEPTHSLRSELAGVLRTPVGTQLESHVKVATYSGPHVCDSALLDAVARADPHLVLLAPPRADVECVRAMVEAIGSHSTAPVVVVLGDAEAAELFRVASPGALDIVGRPLRAVDILPRMWRLLNVAGEAESSAQRLKEKLGLQQLVGESPALLSLVRQIPLVARCDVNVLIQGETGTGKEMCARAIHYLGPRAGKPFVPVNCGAIPEELIENEFFGHERGAFTSAATARPGLLFEANGGTVFLDEIDCLPRFAQVKLLRFLQEKEYRPLGSAKARKADVRVVAATNTDFEDAVRRGDIRRDLFYRINVIPLRIPPLRERREDIPLLARHFLAKFRTELRKESVGFAPGAVESLLRYEWPGNVRELEHVIERAVALAEHESIRGADLSIPTEGAPASPGSFREAKARVVARFEKGYIEQLLATSHGNISQAAQAAQKNRRAFWQLIRKHRIDVSSFRS